MTDDSRLSGNRRTFLKWLGATGVAAGSGTAALGPAAADDHVGEYRQTLLADLESARGLPAGSFVYGTSEQAALDAFTFEDAGAGTSSTFEVDADVPITQGVTLTVNEEPSNAYDYTYQGFISDTSFSAGDPLLAVAYVRSDTEEAQIQAGFKYQYTDPNGETSYSSNTVQESASVTPSAEWTRYYFPIEVAEKPDGSEHTPYLEFWTGYAEQTVEMGGVALLDYGDADVAVGDLPAGPAGAQEGDSPTNPLVNYEGREEGAQWREDARDRIEEVRKTDFEVEVLDEAGNAVEGADVEVAMQDHAFDFGSAVSVTHITGDSEDDQRYREVFLEHFNKAVIENGLKYPSFTGAWGDSKAGAIDTLEWLDDKNIPARGHYLLWEEYNTDGGGGMGIDNPDALSASETVERVDQRIENQATDVGDLVTEWDMHNHPIWQPNFRSDDAIGFEAVEQWWGTADAATDAELYTNEMGNVAGGFFRDQHDEFVGQLIENDLPIDGVGFMGHVQLPEGNVTPPAEILETYDQFAEHDLPILITEFDIQINDRGNDEEVAFQEDLTRDFLIASFSHEAVEGVMSWGFWAGDHWRPTGAYYDEDWTLRPNGQQFMDLVFDEWWTEESSSTDADGVYATTGFKGTYQITASDGEASTERQVQISDDTDAVTVTLSESDAGEGEDDGADGGEETPEGTLPGGQGPPQDLDGDGHFEDVNGDGKRNIADVRSLLNNRNGDTVQANAGAYDFDGDGSVDAGDVLALFRKLYR
ncbi:alkaline phosphatase D protein [Halorhabdus tiamatea SARL4B]|uniref:endo-1,4-beta-xylanase n=1 Tax=Halorhabdus tiamatea SARL4B TaxID=1033806 RepID=F7PQV6_9EURY|nr:endo-1,4-beta-xylanase [Halorhabdus tiamatea]ERJ06875.1 alkaline phosphatase D protein [Halorhabdus tiamatea SARL4B]CCQ32987.1 beta-1,4-xylanase, family GH10 [Halorhabdus tiamatea SARL4B]